MDTFIPSMSEQSESTWGDGAYEGAVFHSCSDPCSMPPPEVVIPTSAAGAAQPSLSCRVDGILARHHLFLLREMPRLRALIDRSILRHPPLAQRLRALRDVYDAFCMRARNHLCREEQFVFPLIRQLESALQRGTPFAGGLVESIEELKRDHQDAGRAIAVLRRMAGDFRCPDDASPELRSLLEGLGSLEITILHHVHEEDNELLPRALEAHEALIHGRHSHRSHSIPADHG